MTIKEDMLRVYDYGKGDYYQAITQQESYQKELTRVRLNYNQRTWIDFKGFYPKFTTDEFNQLRQRYQARYGNTVNVPGFSDVIHIIPQTPITPEERAAHIWAVKRGLPSPLTQQQLNTMQYKKFKFIRALASATPDWFRNYTAIATAADNVEDALVTVTVLGRIAAKIAPRLLGRIVPGLGWVLLGADILNAANLVSYISMASKGKKRFLEGLADKNPFHAKAAANRALKLKRVVPSFGEFLEILQTTDQLFGVGLSLGGLMGTVTDLFYRAMTYSAQEKYKTMPQTGNIDDLMAWAYTSFAVNVESWKKGLIDQWENFKNEAYRLKAADIKLRKDIFDWTTTQQEILWEKIKNAPDKILQWYTNGIMGGWIMSTDKDVYTKDEHTKAYMALNSSIQGLMPWWIENDPLDAFNDLRSFPFRAPTLTDQTTADLLEETLPGLSKPVIWPHLDKEYATIEEITFNYAPRIKDAFQTYCLNHSTEYDAMIAGQQVTEFTRNVIRSYSDDNEVKVGMTAWWAVAEDMLQFIYIIPEEQLDQKTHELAEYVNAYERKNGLSPSINEVETYGIQIGINWIREPPSKITGIAKERFPELSALLDQIPQLFIAD